jgi:hypothetical protein
MTSAIKHEACVNPAVDAFDSSVYSQGHTFKAFPVRIKSDNRPEASIYRERKVEPPMFFLGPGRLRVSSYSFCMMFTG